MENNVINIKYNLKAHIFESANRKSTAIMFSNIFYISTHENKTKLKKSNETNSNELSF